MINTNLRRVTGIALLAMLAFSCKKKSDDVTPTPTPSGDSATLHYMVTSSNRSGGLITWTAATAAGKQVAFKGNRNAGSRVEIYKYNFTTSNFYTPGYELTAVNVPSGTYTDAEFNYQMIPSRDPALQLKGTYTAGASSTPVTVNIDQFVEVATKLASTTLESGKSYKAMINLDLAAISNGISAGDLNNATRTNGEIVIAYYSNPSLLQVIINNINNVVHHQVTITQD
jgi:hypothetical protein